MIRASSKRWAWWCCLGLNLWWSVFLHSQIGLPVITRQPTSPASPVAINSSFSLSVAATGLKLSYQWQRNGVNIPDATSPTLAFPSFQATQGGSYSVLVRNAVGTVQSKWVRLTPSISAMPHTDNWDERVGTTVFPNRLKGNTGVVRGSNTTATREKGEPVHAGLGGGASVWVTYVPSSTGIARFSTFGSDFDTVIAVYQLPPRAPALVSELVEITSDEDGAGFKTSGVQFNVRADSTYFIAVDGQSGLKTLEITRAATIPRGNIVLSWTLIPTSLVIPKFVSPLQNITLPPDAGLKLNAGVETIASQSTGYSWFFNGKPIPDATGANLEFGKLSRSQLGKYFANIFISGADGATTLKTKEIDVQIVNRTDGSDTHVLAEDTFAMAAAYKFSGGPAGPAGFARVAGLALGASGTQVFNTGDATVEEDEPVHCGVGGGHSEWYAIFASARGVLVADTIGSDYDTVLAAYRDTGTGTGLFDGLVEVACNNDSPGNGNASRLVFQTEPNTTYYLAVDGVGEAKGIAQINYLLGNQLAITTPPAAATVNSGGSVTLQVAAVGTGTLSYQWRREGVNVPGATASSLLLPSISPAQGGTYTVLVTDAIGSVVSPGALVTVRVAPSFALEPVSQSVNAGAAVAFSVAVTGNPTPVIQWRKNGVDLAGKTGTTLNLANVTPTDAGDYTAVASNAAGSRVSAVASLIVRSIPAITAQPVSRTVTAGAAVAFQVVATGVPTPTFQWKKNGANLDGQTSSTLNIPAVTTANEGTYTVEVSSPAGSVTSSPAILTVHTIPVITAQPIARTAVAGTPVVFQVAASGIPVPTYQWRRNGDNLPGQNSATLTLPSVQPSDEGSYSVLVSNAAGNIASAAASLTIQTAPTITSQPAAKTVVEGATAVFQVAATGSPAPNYQWRKNESNIPGQTNASLTLENVTASHAGSYSVVVSNPAGTRTSAAALLTVHTIPIISSQPVSRTVNAGAAVQFEVSATGNPGPAFQWRKNGSNLPGQTGSILALPSVTPEHEGTYSALVSNAAGSVTSANATLVVQVPPAITSQPVSRSATPGSTVTFQVTATGSPAPAYQWQKNGTPLPGQTAAVLTLNSITAANEGSYSVVVSSAAGSITSAIVTLTVQAGPAITLQPVSQTVAQGGTATFVVAANGNPAPAFQWKKNGSDLPGKTSPTLVLSNVSAGDQGTYIVVVSNAAGSSTSDPATLSIQTVPVITLQPESKIAAAGSDVQFQTAATGNPAPQIQWLKNGIVIPGKNQPLLVLTGVTQNDSGEYAATASNPAGEVQTSVARLQVAVPPVFLTAPASQTTAPGGSARFAVTVGGSPPPSLQWSKNGVPIPNETGLAFQISNIQASDAADYTVTAVNIGGTVVSPIARLVVQGLPSFAAFGAPESVLLGGQARFTAQATGEPAPTIQWRKNGADLPGRTGPSFVIDNVQLADEGVYSAAASNPAGTVLSRTAALVVHIVPSITAAPQGRTATPGSTVHLNVVAAGKPTPAIQWRKNGVDIPGAIQTTLTLANFQATDAGSYTAVAQNAAGTATSSEAILSLAGAPTITQSPQSRSINKGGRVEFDVVVSSPVPVTYQWQFNEVPLVGRTTRNLVLENLQSSQAGRYRVAITSATGTALSATAELVILESPAITRPPAPLSVVRGAPIALTVEATGSPPPAYQWYFNGAAVASATAPFLNIPSADTIHAGSYWVSASNAAGAVTSAPVVVSVGVGITIVAQPQSVSTSPGSTVEFRVVASSPALMSYQWQKNGVVIPGATGPILSVQAFADATYRVLITSASVNILSEPAVLSVVSRPLISAHPRDLRATVGQTARFSVTASGAPPLTYQWEFEGQLIPRATSSILTLVGIQPGNAGLYRCRVTNGAGTTISDDAELQILGRVGARLKIEVLGNEVFFDVQAIPNQAYALERSTDFRNWSFRKLFVTPSSGTGTLSESLGPAGTPYFYRMVER